MLNRVLMSGVVSDIPAYDAPPDKWTEASGVNFRQGVAERVSGWRSIYGATTADPLHIRNSFFKGVNYWLYATDVLVKVVDAAGTHSTITPTSAPNEADPNVWTSCELNGLPVLNDGSTRGPMYWGRSTGTVCQPLPDWPSGYTCQVIRAYRSYLIALNIYDSST
jgi:hypothetical protein